MEGVPGTTPSTDQLEHLARRLSALEAERDSAVKERDEYRRVYELFERTLKP